jgi:hypothetical protein
MVRRRMTADLLDSRVSHAILVRRAGFCADSGVCRGCIGILDRCFGRYRILLGRIGHRFVLPVVLADAIVMGGLGARHVGRCFVGAIDAPVAGIIARTRATPTRAW